MSLEIKQAMKLCIDGKKIKAVSKYDKNDFVIVYLDDYIFSFDTDKYEGLDVYPEEFYFTDKYTYEVVKEKVVKYRMLYKNDWGQYQISAKYWKSLDHHQEVTGFRSLQVLESTAKEFEE